MHPVWPSRRSVDHEEHPHPSFNPNARPDFFCIGAQRAGTTWLYHQLNSHPDFWMPPVKELHYFDKMSRSRHPDRSAWSKLRIRDHRDRHFLQAVERLCSVSQVDLQLYGQLFSLKGLLLSGDITPAYSTLPEEIIAAIVKQFPELKVIFLARDPVERVWSNLSKRAGRGGLEPFDVTDSRAVLRNLFHAGIIMRSYPSMIVARWRRYVRPELFQVYFFDDLESDPDEVRRSIIQFLGGDPEKSSDQTRVERKINENKRKLPLTDPVRSLLARFFEEELRTCATKLGGAAKKWPARYGFLSIFWFIQLACDCDDFVWDLFIWW